MVLNNTIIEINMPKKLHTRPMKKPIIKSLFFNLFSSFEFWIIDHNMSCRK